MVRKFAVVAIVTVANTGCAPFGYSTNRPSPTLFIENRGANRYVYEMVRTPYGSTSTADARSECARIFVRIEYSGWGTEGARTLVDGFMPNLEILSRELCGGAPAVLELDRDRWQLITRLTVSVVRIDHGGSGTELPPISIR